MTTTFEVIFERTEGKLSFLLCIVRFVFMKLYARNVSRFSEEELAAARF